MEIKLPTPQLQKTLDLASRISTKHVTLPVLQCVLIEAGKQGIIIRSTNLEIGVEVTVVGEVVEEGQIAVPAQTLWQTIQLITQPEVVLRVEDQVLVVEAKNTNTSIKAVPHDEFPIPHKLEGQSHQVQRSLFSLGIKTAAFAASQSSIKPELGSIFIQQKKEHTLTFVATDSFRLMEKTVPQKGLILEQPIMVPQKNALELARLCDLLTADPKLYVTDNQCALAFPEGVYVISRLVTGSFPDYTQIIPKEYVSHVTVLKEDLQKAFKKTGVFLNKFRQVTIAITSDGLTVSAQNAEVGHVTDTVPASVEGECELTLNFNQQYVVDPLAHVSDESVVLHFAGLGRPLVMEGVRDGSLRYLVMPMNR